MRFLILLIMILFPINSFAQNGPSFDCKIAKTKNEKQICSNPILSKKDVELNNLYKIISKKEFGNLKTGQIYAQKIWLKDIKNCETITGNEAIICLNSYYDMRIKELSLDAIFMNKDNSIEKLQSNLKESNNLYYALYEYLYSPKTISRDAKIAKLLSPHFKALIENHPFPKSILNDEKIFKLEDALINDDKFFQALALISLSDDEDFTIPCAAILKNPKAINATKAYFGSSWDGQLPNSNCENFLPFLQNMSALNSIVWSNMPDCSGTIRFAFYRDLSVNYDEILLGRYKIEGKNNKYDPLSIKLKTKNITKFNAAANELANYYNQTKFKIGANNVSTSAILLDYIDKAMQMGC